MSFFALSRPCMFRNDFTKPNGTGPEGPPGAVPACRPLPHPLPILYAFGADGVTRRTGSRLIAHRTPQPAYGLAAGAVVWRLSGEVLNVDGSQILNSTPRARSLRVKRRLAARAAPRPASLGLELSCVVCCDEDVHRCSSPELI